MEYLAHQMRKAGFWAIDIQGIAESPTYIVINNQKLNLGMLPIYGGMETAETQQVMLGGLSPKEAATVAIGPAGEQLIKYAASFQSKVLFIDALVEGEQAV